MMADEVEKMLGKATTSEQLASEAERRCLELKLEVKRFREKSQDLEAELEQIRQRNVETHNLDAQSTL